MSKIPDRSGRTTQPRQPAKPGAKPAEVERAIALRDVMDHVVETQKEITDPKPLDIRRRRAVTWTIICVPLLALCAYSWLARPEFVWGPDPKSVPQVRQDANARFTLFLLSRRIEEYKRTSGSFPPTLDAVPGAPRDVSYRRLSDSGYELSITSEGRPIVFRSDEPVAQFLGRAPVVLSGRER